MRRIIIIGLLVAIVPWIVIGIVREGTDDDTNDAYFVRAIFDNASTVVAGEDVKIAGVPVGVISDMNVTDEEQAAVTLRIDDENFTPWRADASCTIRAQGLIGEKFVECEPGSTDAPALRRIREGDGEGERLLPVDNTSSPVDLDLLNNIMRLPYRERLSLLLDEFGTALAGRGEELNEVIHRANPALRETDEVLAILAKQNRELARLARNSDEVLGPLARERESVADFVVQANATGEASAERRGDISRGIELLPDFLAELEPLMADLEGFADQGIPLLRDLGDAAPALGRLIKAQGTLADASRESFPSLGDALERGRPALIRSRPLFQDLNKLEPRPDRRPRAPQRASLLLGAVAQRLRRHRPLPARRTRHEPLLDLRDGDLRRLQRELLRPDRGGLRGRLRRARAAQRHRGQAGGRQRRAPRRAAAGPARRRRHGRGRPRARAEPRCAA
jgi:virulence factor Mce-like protein